MTGAETLSTKETWGTAVEIDNKGIKEVMTVAHAGIQMGKRDAAWEVIPLPSPIPSRIGQEV
jgi:hypothetical protein